MPVGAPLYPVNLIVAGRPCLVVGGGAVAARKAATLVAAGAAVHVVAPLVSAAVRSLPVTWDERPYEPSDLDGRWLVITATDDADVNAAVAVDANAARVWVNSADDPANCSFVLPAVVRRGDLQVTVSTGGHSPALATWLNGRFESELGPEYEVLLGVLSAERDAIRASGRSTEGLDWQKALDSGMLDLIRAGDVQRARERLQACLSSSSA